MYKKKNRIILKVQSNKIKLTSKSRSLTIINNQIKNPQAVIHRAKGLQPYEINRKT